MTQRSLQLVGCSWRNVNDEQGLSRIAGEAATEARIEELVGLVDRVEGESARSAIFSRCVECTAHQAIIVRRIENDFTEVTCDVKDLVGGRDIALQTGPIGPAIAEKSGCRGQKTVLIASCRCIEIEGRTKVAILRSRNKG